MIDWHLVISAVSIAIALLSLRLASKRSSTDDEVKLTERIARSKDVEVEVRKIAEATCRESFQGRGPWVKELAREVFNDRLQMIMNEGTFLDSKVFGEFRGALTDELKRLSSAIEKMQGTLADQPRQMKDLLIEIRREGVK